LRQAYSLPGADFIIPGCDHSSARVRKTPSEAAVAAAAAVRRSRSSLGGESGGRRGRKGRSSGGGGETVQASVSMEELMRIRDSLGVRNIPWLNNLPFFDDELTS